MARLGDICKFQSGGTPSKNNSKFYNGTIPWITTVALNGNTIGEESALEWITDEAIQESSAKIVPQQSIMVGTRVGIGKVAINSVPMSTSQDIISLVDIDESIWDKHFLCKFILSKNDLLISQSRGATIKGIRIDTLSNLIVPDILIDEQRKIAAVLDKVSDLIAKRRQQLDKLDELVKAKFVEMFGNININDKGWNIQPLGEFCTIVRGGSPRPIDKYLGGDVPWIKISDATEGESIYLNSTKEHIIREGVSKSRMVKSGSLIFANCGVSLGFARIITFDGCIHDGWLAMEDIDLRLNKIFLLHTLNQMTEHFRKIAPAGTQTNLNTSIMKAYKQIIPPMQLQNEFILFVEQTEKTKTTISKSLEQLETLKKALMQKYFG